MDEFIKLLRTEIREHNRLNSTYLAVREENNGLLVHSNSSLNSSYFIYYDTTKKRYIICVGNSETVVHESNNIDDVLSYILV